jgi:predicted N-acetyltransferase YhbS
LSLLLKYLSLSSISHTQKEEKMVGAVAVSLSGGSRKKEATLKALAVLSSRQGEGIGNQLLRRAEAVCRGHGCDTVKIDVAMRRDSIVEWLKRHGFKNLAGGAWTHDGCVEVTQYMSMVKDLTIPDEAVPPSATATTTTTVISSVNKMEVVLE